MRIHQGAGPAELSASLQATAFTVGSKIFLGADAARPGTSTGNQLLAHELGHVVDEGGGGTVGRVRRLASGAALRTELGGPSSHSKTYRKLIAALDSYDGVLRWKLVADTPGLIKDAGTLETLVKEVIDACAAFLAGHQKDKRAGVVADVKAQAARERASLRLRTAELQAGEKPTWATWKEAIETTSETTTRDLKAEKGYAVGGDKGNMNEVTKFAFGIKIGERGNGSFFKGDKASVGDLEDAYASGIGIPRGAEAYGATEHDLTGPRFAQRAVATSRIDKLLNANVIAKTQYAVRNSKDHPGGGQIMDKAKGTQAGLLNADAVAGRAPGFDVDDPVMQRMMSKLDLLDSLCGQIDRHGGNFFVDTDHTGKVTSVTGIDNDMAFGTRDFTPGQTVEETVQYAGIGKYIDDETGEAILKLTDTDLHAVLDDLLLPDEIAAAIERLKTTQAVIQKAKNEGRLIGPERWGKDTTGVGGFKYGKKADTGYHANVFHAPA